MNMSALQLSEQEQLRREKLAELIMMGIEPYPAPLFPVNLYSTDIKEKVNKICEENIKEQTLSVGLNIALEQYRSSGNSIDIIDSLLK